VLRISIEPGNSLVTMRLEGKVVGPWVEECHRTWDAIREGLGSKKLRLDVRGVMFMDDRGTALLRKIHRMSGAEVVANSPLTNYFAEQIRREIKQFENEGV
jgi:hypothetical protein